MEKNLFFSNSFEQPLQATTETEVVPQVNGVEEIVIYDECGDTMWDKVLAQGDRVVALKKDTLG